MNCIECKIKPVQRKRKICTPCIINRQMKAFIINSKIVGSSAWSNAKRKQFKTSAKRRGIEFSLTSSEIRKLYADIDKPCPYCNGVMEVPSLDRVKNSIGYHAINCIVVCNPCNIIKNKLSKIQLENMLRITSERENL